MCRGVRAMQARISEDEELVSRIREGDAESLDVLVKAYMPRTFRKVRKVVPAEDAEDVTQDIFLNLVRSIGNFQGRSAFATWFDRIISNRIADYYRKKFRYGSRFASEELPPEHEPFQEANSSMEIDDLLLSLPQHYREVILMKTFHNLSFGEIASVLDMTYEAARSRYRRGIKYAANRIKPELLLHN